MKTRRNRRGFTMAEMLIVVAIIAVLSGVSFIAVHRYQRSMAQLERDAIAKEIFVAAQNHLTVAEGQSFLNMDETAYGTPLDAEKGIYCFVSNESSGLGNNATLLDLMLPFGSVDETVRQGGCYFVRYQLKPAAVLDVFYSPGSSGRFSHAFSDDEYDSLESYKGIGNTRRRNYGDAKAVIGWYGGEAEQEKEDIRELASPTIVVKNEERLKVMVTDPNNVATNTELSLKLIIKGEKSGAMAAIPLGLGITSARVPADEMGSSGYDYTIILDDVTSDALHFAQLNNPTDTTIDRNDASFLPGEDITISAVACGKTVLTNIAYSGEVTTNSLFADLEPAEGESATGNAAQIANFRHLENLGSAVSGVAATNPDVNITAAAQLADLDWDGFVGAIRKQKSISSTGAVKVYCTAASDGADNASGNGCYMPISPDYALAYDGQNHWINGVRVGVGDGVEPFGGDAGLFGTTAGNSKISNLALTNFSISAKNSGNAGALAGTLNNTDVNNVVAYYGAVPASAPAEGSGDVEGGAGGEGGGEGGEGGEGGGEGGEGGGTPSSTSPTPQYPEDESGVRIVSSGGSAGGLVGSASGGGLTRCAAALYVSGANAGGLVGETRGAELTACYSGGHTNEGKYEGDVDSEPSYAANIVATGDAGGLIGSASGGKIEGCYSTCSVSGATAGGLVGEGGAEFKNCYATGRVTGTTAAGAFAGTLSGSADDKCRYIMIINEEINETTGATYLPAVGGEGTTVDISAADANAAAYNSFMGSDFTDNPAEWPIAVSYDATLTTYYGGKYPLKFLTQEDDFASKHYGDWPVPELFVMN